MTTDIYTIEGFDPKRAFGRLLARVRHALLERIGERLEPLGLTGAQWAVVVLLWEGSATTPAELSRLLDYDPGAMTRLIDRLEEKDYVKRVRNSDDRRSVKLELTERAKEQYPKSLPLIVDVYNELLDGFTKEEVRQFEGFLARILDNA